MPNQSEITGSTHVLAVQNLAASVDYYTSKLGLKTVWHAEGWYCLRRGKFSIMLGECPDDVSAFHTRNHSYFAYVDVEHIDKLHSEYHEKDVEIISKLEDKPWNQREFGIRTIDGHRIMFGTEINS